VSATDKAPVAAPLARVRARRLILGPGTTTTRLFVECPVQARLVAHDVCTDCPLGEAPAGDERREHHVACKELRAEIPRPARSLEDPIFHALSQLLCVSENVLAKEAVSALVDFGASGAAVVDAGGNLVGVVTKSDVGRASTRAGDVPVRDVMTPSHFSLAPTATLSEAAALMAWKGVHRVPIVAASGEVLGLLGALDVIRWIAPGEAPSPGSP
jgi:CBS domain-containing protein